MKLKPIAFLFAALSAAAVARAQSGKIEPITVNDQRVLKFTGPHSTVFVIAQSKIGADPALTLGVGHRHGFGQCYGVLLVSRNSVAFQSSDIPDHNVTLSREELKTFAVNDYKSMGRTMYRQMVLKTQKKDYNFFPFTGQSGFDHWDDYSFVLDWFTDVVLRFDEAMKKFDAEFERQPAADLLVANGQNLELTEKYDKFKDITISATSRMYLAPNTHSVTFRAAVLSPGAKPARPETAILYIDADDSVRRLFKSDRSLIFLVDGERLKLGEMNWLDSRYIPGGRYYSGSVIDELGLTIPWETFLKIANGKVVEFQVGTVEAKLEGPHLALLKKLIARVEN
jgi:hypothetical protein